MDAKQTILAIDDEPRNLKILLLGIRGEWEISTAASGEEGMAYLKTAIPEVVLLDIMMPGIDGYEVTRLIRQDPRLEFTKVILVSGRALLEERLKGYEVGADDYMTKPFIPEELTAKVKVFMRLSLVEKQLKEFNLALEQKVALRTEQLLNAEAMLVNSAKMSALGEMAGGIAHEINTPLGIISLLSGQIQDLLQEEPLEKETILNNINKIEQTTHRIAEIILGLRTFSRDSSKDGFEIKSLKDILENTLSLCQEKFRNHDIKFSLEPVSEDLTIACRPSQISQVILNLLNNSCDAIDAQNAKWIQLKCDADETSIKIKVTDSGNGIPKNIVDKLFQPFFTTKDVGKGTGLGLSISKGLVEAHGGKISIDSSNPNTSFIVEIPFRQVEKGV